MSSSVNAKYRGHVSDAFRFILLTNLIRFILLTNLNVFSAFAVFGAGRVRDVTGELVNLWFFV